MSDQKCHTLSAGFIAMGLISTRARQSVCLSVCESKLHSLHATVFMNVCVSSRQPAAM